MADQPRRAAGRAAHNPLGRGALRKPGEAVAAEGSHRRLRGGPPELTRVAPRTLRATPDGLRSALVSLYLTNRCDANDVCVCVRNIV
ncbi:hypothetical protein A33M_2449 [Rhodovulum sp. PH10]|nr:hypothetical protein A33M_2449 [Rhodovulum sp. PH10]